MGQTAATGDGTVPVPTEIVEAGRPRHDYYSRLGIMKDQPHNFRRPCKTVEAPGILESFNRDRSQSDGGTVDPTAAVKGDEAEGDAGDARGFEMNETEVRCQDDFRVQYLRRLSYEKVWVPRAQRPPQHQTVVIFDWDDTLLCTTYLNMRPAPKDQPLSPVVERHIRGIEAADRKLLTLAMRLGHTFIITNATTGWVELSAANYMPDLLPLLQRVPVISARGKFESLYPGEVSKWKEEAFLEVQRQLDSKIITNLISLGDSNFEMEAVHVMGRAFNQALVKTIKFRENPSPEELLKQLELVAQKFDRIVENAKPLKIGLERKYVGNSATQQKLQQPMQGSQGLPGGVASTGNRQGVGVSDSRGEQ
eukprot:TRINITY_DN76450_c0_g1_i1.p1 TRINITY_DN76450_c0_g1~~TRINITY_DN76450_c0_g1_i1.p1  ORF type:complete len:365 (+),score=80.17 TRINITY_DN76450_c0_g1_i1:206-1300(+)